MSIPWREVAYGWLVCSLLVGMVWSVWYDRCGWVDADEADLEDPLTVPAEWAGPPRPLTGWDAINAYLEATDPRPRFDGGQWVPEGWRT